VRQVEATVQAAGIDVGGIEYLVDDRDGQAYLYDVNALSNFVADAVNVVGFDPFARLVDYLKRAWRRVTGTDPHRLPPRRPSRVTRRGGLPARHRERARGGAVRYGYWLTVFGGWLRNVPDEGMDASWAYAKRLAQRSEQIGYDLTLIAELFLNDIKGSTRRRSRRGPPRRRSRR
jgi:hypothetical protein